jgi:hypothetical protein
LGNTLSDSSTLQTLPLREGEKLTSIICGMELVSDNKTHFRTSSDTIKALKKGDQSTEKVHSGRFSLKTSYESFLETYLGYATPGSSVVIQAWVHGKPQNFNIILSSRNSEEFYKGSRQTLETDENGWTKYILQVQLPENKLENGLVFYFWNISKDEVFVDDLTISYVKDDARNTSISRKSSNWAKNLVISVFILFIILLVYLKRNYLRKIVASKREPGVSKSLICLLIIAFISIYSVFNTHRWTRKNEVISWDIISYYAYLPASFIYHDISLKFTENKTEKDNYIFWPKTLPNGNKVIMTSMGLSMLYSPFFFVAHGYASLTGGETSGYSPPYQIALVLSAIFYLLLGMFVLRNILLQFFSETISAITLIAIYFGTNLFYYTTFLAPMPHAYCFALFAVFLYLVLMWHKKPKLLNTIWVGLTLGLISLVRPTNAIIVFFLIFWGVTSMSTLKDKLIFFLKHYKMVLVMVLATILVWLPQMLYWHKLTGQYMFYSYGDDGAFYFNNPHILQGLFSFRNGWLVYSPIMFFSLIGIVFLRNQLRIYIIPIIIFAALNIYIILSWWCWWYTGFGNRAFIDSYALLAIPLAAFLHYIASLKTRIIKYSITLVFFLVFVLGVFHTVKYYYSSIHYCGMTKEAYWESFWGIRPQGKYWDLLKLPDYEKAKKGIDAYEESQK